MRTRGHLAVSALPESACRLRQTRAGSAPNPPPALRSRLLTRFAFFSADDFSCNGDPFPDPADIPNSGPPLLNSLENTFLGDFFFSQSQQTATTDFDFATALAASYHQAQDHAQRFSEPDFNWLITEPPPTLVEAAPALPKSPTPPAHNFQAMPMDFPAFSNAGVPVTQPAPTEVLNSATTTTQPLHVAPPTLVRAHTTSAVETLHAAGAIPAVVSPQYTPAHSIPATSPDLVFGFSRPLTSLEPLSTSVAHGYGFGGPHTAPPLPSRGEEYNSRLYRFGSDSHFAGSGFQPQNSSENAKAIEKSLLGNLYIIQPITHNEEDTRGSSPDNQSRKRSAPLGDDDEVSEEDSLKKRRRAESDAERSAVRRTSQINFKARRLPYADHKRRRSSATAVKPPRENLTEEQKRNNHIMSEQKRRDLIKRGFEELHHLVPELRVGGLSKSSVLMEAAAFLEKLVDVNAELRRRLGKFD